MPPRIGAFIAIVLWGISFVATKSALREISPVTLIFLRFALGTAFLLLLLLAQKKPLIPPRGYWPSLALMGFVGVFVHQMLQAFALTMTSAVHTGWLIGLTPLWSAVLAAIFLRERFPFWKISGLVVAFLGAILVVSRGRLSLSLIALPSTRGDLLILASTVNWAVYTILGQKTLRALGPSRATAGSMLIGWLMLAPFFVARAGWSELPRLSGRGWGAVLFLGIGCSGIGYLLWYGALEKVETSRVAALLYLEPIVTLLAAVALLGEPVRVVTVIGGLLVLVGVVIVQRAPISPPARGPEEPQSTLGEKERKA